ncbi:MAG: outer membrane protein transport protein [Granulosicoccus sp.]|nr:outer membrane protein transport protein [Granulosicoccus sp.]
MHTDKNKAKFRLFSCIAVIGIGAGWLNQAHSGGFALIEHGASGLGNAYAGAAAVSADGSTVWFNAAGMSEIKSREFSLALHGLSTSTKWTDEGSALGSAFGGAQVSGPQTSNPGTTTALPNVYYVAPINDKWHYGLSIGVPFGSSTEYDDDWKGRYTTVSSSLNVIDINPALSYRVSDKVRLGVGLSFQRLSVELGSAVDSGTACLGLISTAGASFSQTDCFNNGLVPGNRANDGYAEVTGDSTGIGFNLGALFLPRDDVKIGLAYRHSVDHDLDGDADFDVNPQLQTLLASNTNPSPESQAVTQGIFRDVSASAEVELPATFSVSGAWQIYDKLQLLSDMTWTGWSSFQELRINFDNPVQSDTVSIQDWQDVFRYSVGLNYQIDSKLTLRGGLAFDEEAIPNAQRRTARIPGNDRTWYAIGASYSVSDKFSFDLGFTHLTLDETPIDNDGSDPSRPGTGQIVRGLYDSSINILSAQVNWTFK